MGKNTVNFLAEFDKELWSNFKDKMYPFGYSIKDLVRDLIKIFIGDLDGVKKELIEEIRKNIKE